MPSPPLPLKGQPPSPFDLQRMFAAKLIYLSKSLKVSCRKPTGFSTILSMSRYLSVSAFPPPYTGSRDILDKRLFRKELSVLAAQVAPAKTRILLKAESLKGVLMDLPKIKTVVPDPSDTDGDRLVLLNVSDESDLSEEAKHFLTQEATRLKKYEIQLDYDYWTADEILQSFLPEELREGSPSGFAMTGHIAHINLNNEYLPYKHIIGQVILDKNSRVKTVVNKLDSIDNQFRFFKMELIAGEPCFIVEHRESDCRFTFDFTQVYWNSRLHTEHERLVCLFKPEDVIVDVFAGVGPFAVPAAKKGCAVLANDLNPQSAKYLLKNVQDNRVSDLVHVTCEDGRDIIRAAARRVVENPLPPYLGPKMSRTQAEKERRSAQKHTPKVEDNELAVPATDSSSPRRRISHFVMNLPDSAITFLDAFKGILGPKDGGLSALYEVMPMIHCHCFTRELEPDKAEQDIRKRVEEKLGSSITEDVSLHLVRSVAPNKEMYCISFRLPRDAAFGLPE